MKVAIVHNDYEKTLAVVDLLKTELIVRGVELDDAEPDIVIAVGGDGTLLSAVKRYIKRINEIKFASVHAGHLGFYSDWQDFELSELAELISSGPQKSVSYRLLKLTLTRESKKEVLYALNEATLKCDNSRTLMASVTIDDIFFENFRGDGLSVSTPSGSTAYNKSLGGAVIHPSLNALQLTEIASINNRVFRTLGSPTIVGTNQVIKIDVKAHQTYMLNYDQSLNHYDDLKSVEFQISNKKVNFIADNHLPFWARVRDAFI
ncbi:MAG: NAD kinase [Lactobacillales bacterium]|jgi:NAD+ kinase|nr:NAD kinase [Lactobacillales bacterium]